MTFKQSYNVNAIATIAGVYLLNNVNYYKKLWKEIRNEREFVIGELKKIPTIKVYPSHSNSVLIYIKKPKLWNLIKNCNKIESWESSEFLGLPKGFFRILITTPSKNREIIAYLKNLGN
jgi:histidinol-phosphate/aromatic aminotransferase/cobyric acid decarboxylase-like protein